MRRDGRASKQACSARAWEAGAPTKKAVTARALVPCEAILGRYAPLAPEGWSSEEGSRARRHAGARARAAHRAAGRAIARVRESTRGTGESQRIAEIAGQQGDQRLFTQMVQTVRSDCSDCSLRLFRLFTPTVQNVHPDCSDPSGPENRRDTSGFNGFALTMASQGTRSPAVTAL